MSKKRFDYFVAVKDSPSALADEVIRYAEDGYRPCGGVAVSVEPARHGSDLVLARTHIQYLQAMTWESEEKPE